MYAFGGATSTARALEPEPARILNAMASAYEGVTPLDRDSGNHAASAVHEHLRALILAGVIKPGTMLNQVELAPLLGVSRTPLREAIRMLQEEGLVDAEPQKRARVREFDVAQLEAVYAQRILLEGLGARLTAPRIEDERLKELEQSLADMSRLAKRHDLDAWQAVHRRFHTRLVAGANAPLREAMRGQMDRGEYYRFIYQVSGPRGWAERAAEHESIVERYRARDGRGAAMELATHLARTALGIIAQVVPQHDPVIIREALACHSAAAPPTLPIMSDAEPVARPAPRRSRARAASR
jgi:DNA-binding GntR family transcriptional regulator